MSRTGIVSGAVLVFGMAYLSWTWLQRHESTVRMERTRMARRGGREIAPAETTGVRITGFYARSGEVYDGDRNLVCYGVENARSVRLEPPVEELTPALSRCFWTEPRQDTTYRLVADGFDGSQASAAFDVRVRPAPPSILFVEVSDGEVRRGDPVTMCYGVKHTRELRLEPIGWRLQPVEKHCAKFFPATTLQYTLVASGSEGRTDREKFRVKVR